jgi:acyl carrier protein
MEKQIVKQRLDTIFQDIFDEPSLEIRDDMTAADVEAWDSLSHVNLIFAVEKQFKIKLSMTEVMALKNVGDFMTLIMKKAA